MGYVDFALEIAEQQRIAPKEIQTLKELAVDFGYQAQDVIVGSVQKLTKDVVKNPQIANQTVSIWNTSQHPYADFQQPQKNDG